MRERKQRNLLQVTRAERTPTFFDIFG
jgi:hypothetical protein